MGGVSKATISGKVAYRGGRDSGWFEGGEKEGERSGKALRRQRASRFQEGDNE